jgi:hypothetical protein
MVLLGGLFALVIGSLLVVLYNLRRAPEGYEDENGFHVLEKRTHGSRILSVKKHSGPATPSPSLKRIKA